MRDYKGWTDAQRRASLEKTKEAIARGELAARPSRCERCGQDQGILEWHNEDYSHPTKHLVGVCYRCHIICYHSAHINAAAVEHYCQQIERGVRWPPMFKRDFGTLAKDNGVSKYRRFDPRNHPEPR